MFYNIDVINIKRGKQDYTVTKLTKEEPVIDVFGKHAGTDLVNSFYIT